LGLKTADKLIPYITPPEDVRPGVVTLFATTCRECPAGCGMHLWHRDGRVNKAEGNPDHPVNRGGLCARGQSSLQGLYDPDRVREILHRPGGRPGRGQVEGWATAVPAIAARLRQSGGRAVIVSDLQTGALAEIMEAFAAAFGGGRVLHYEPFNYEPLRTAHRTVFGRDAIPDYRLDDCDLIVSFAADFLETWVSPVRFARQFSRMHSWRDGRIGRLAYVGPRVSMTAANADDMLLVPPGAERSVALAMLNVVLDASQKGAEVRAARRIPKVTPREAVAAAGGAGGSVEALAKKTERLAKRFVEAKASVALAGPAGAWGEAATDTAVAAALMNYAAGRIGQTVDFSRAHALGGAAGEEQVRLALEGLGPNDVLIIHSTNLAFTRPWAAEQIRKAGTVVYLGTLPDETAELADWVLPIDTPLETWGDYEPMSGAECLMQPTMTRLYDTRPSGDVLLALAEEAGRPLARKGGTPPADTREWLRQRWNERHGEESWHESVRSGGLWQEPAAAKVELSRQTDEVRSSATAPSVLGAGEAALWLWPAVLRYDGRTANRGWIQESPEPVSFVAWGSWVDVHPRQALALGLFNSDILVLETPTGRVEAPVRITEEVAEGVVALAFGQGHTAAGLRTACGRGASAFELLGGGGVDRPAVVKLRKAGRQGGPIYDSGTQLQHERELLQWVTPAELAKGRPEGDGKFTLPLPEGYDPKKDMYAPHTYKDHRWSMVIDLQKCVGCGACAVACYAENNLAVTGPEQTNKTHHMPWLRVVPYRDDEDARRVGFLPLLCQHCDSAPCEPVCPVFASVHNEEGLNAQVYNRCIGTRYCSNNCPYKVRRFNWLNPEWKKPLDVQLNPEVTVRSRGVMEKCTFCIQRIRSAEHTAKRENRPLRDGDVQPACVQSCPSGVFTFGDLLDPNSRVSQLVGGREGIPGDPRRYHVLEELNTKPGVAYLRRIKQEEG
jgi:molybdopterin-containing oxidoreductase family iron-sulfur binding subunit